MSIIFSHPTGNANSRAAVLSLAKGGSLKEFHTSIASFPNSILDKISIGPLKEIKRRSYDSILQPFTISHPLMESCRMIAAKAGLQKLTRHEKGIFCIDAVYKQLDGIVSKGLKQSKAGGLTGVYSYEDGASATFKKAKEIGLRCFYDLPIGYWRSSQRLLSIEREKWPEWASTLTGLIDSNTKLANKDNELRLADCVFVASSFTASTLNEFPGVLPPIEIIPYGFPQITSDKDFVTFANKRRLKLLFVGGLSQRKGIADLFEAVQGLSDYVELTVVGTKPNVACPALDNALSKHRWIPSLPHAEILQLMRAHDVFVFPSLFEGFGLVITEAMSQGIPVITTDRTAGPDLITNNENGWLITAGSSESLRAAIEKLISEPSLISKAGKAAIETARKRPWEVYGSQLLAAIQKHS